MKTWEMIRELQENPNKKFESECWNVVKMINNVLYWEAFATCMGGEVKVNNDFLNAEWEEVIESVSFIEAARTGKRIKPCITIPNNHSERSYDIAESLKEFHKLSDVIFCLQVYSDKEIEEYITNIKWYVE